MSLLLLFPSNVVSTNFCWTRLCFTRPDTVYSAINPGFLDTWGDWAAYRWDQISRDHAGPNDTWAFMAGVSFGSCEVASTGTGGGVVFIASLPLLLNQQPSAGSSFVGWSQYNYDFLDTWVDWSGYTWAQISATHGST